MAGILTMMVEMGTWSGVSARGAVTLHDTLTNFAMLALAGRGAHPAALRLAARHGPLAMQLPTHAVLAERICTLAEPCAFDAQTALELFTRVAITTGVAVGIVVVLSSFMTGNDDEIMDVTIDGGRSEAGGAIDQQEETTASGDGGGGGGGGGWLESQAERSRARREDRLRDLADRLEPVTEITGWKMRGADGLPTLDAYVFLGVAIAAQLLIVQALASALSS